MQCLLYRIECINGLYRRGFGTNGLNLVVQFLVTYEDQFYCSIIQDKFKLIDIDGGIDGCEYGPCLLYGKIKDHPLRPVVAEDGNLVSSLDGPVLVSNACTHEPHAEVVDQLLNFCCAVFSPNAILFGGKHVFLWKFLKLPIEAVKQSGRGHKWQVLASSKIFMCGDTGLYVYRIIAIGTSFFNRFL